MLGRGVGSEKGFDGETRESRIEKRRSKDARFVCGASAEFGCGISFLGQSGDSERRQNGAGVSGVVPVGGGIECDGGSRSFVEPVKGHRVVRENLDRVGCSQSGDGSQHREEALAEIKEDTHR